MVQESNIQPVVAFEINELPGGMSEVIFYENVVSIPDEEQQKYSYNIFCVQTPSRANLATDVENNYTQWIEFARASENNAEPPSQNARLAALEAENIRLKEENTLIADALDEFICIMLGGE